MIVSSRQSNEWLACCGMEQASRASEQDGTFFGERARSKYLARARWEEEGATTPPNSLSLLIHSHTRCSFYSAAFLFRSVSHFLHLVPLFAGWAVVLTTRVYFLSLFPPTSLERGTMKLQIDGTLHEEVV